MNRALALAVLALIAGNGAPAHPDDLRTQMEEQNARWLRAFNTPDAQAFLALYTDDAILLPQGESPVTGGPEAIKKFWEEGIKAGVRNHTFEIIDVKQDGKYAYQVARWTVEVTKKDGKKAMHSGNTVRIFERQADGNWKTRVHMYNSHSG